MRFDIREPARRSPQELARSTVGPRAAHRDHPTATFLIHPEKEQREPYFPARKATSFVVRLRIRTSLQVRGNRDRQGTDKYVARRFQESS